VKHLIVNADDFGYTRGVNRAIVEGYRTGIITSTSLMANGEAFDDAVAHANREPRLDVGCHINLVEGKPVSPQSAIPHLVRSDGTFHSLYTLGWRLTASLIPASELERECSAQIEKLLEAGIQPSHIDSHKHTHLHPRVARALAKAARRFSIPWMRRPFENCRPAGIGDSFTRSVVGGSLRLVSGTFQRIAFRQQISLPDFFTGFTLTGRWTRQAMEDTLSVIRGGTTELMCHPGYCDAELDAMPTRLKQQREREFEIMADGTLRERLRELGIVLKSFRNASDAARGIADPAGNPIGFGLAQGE
jgi:chitin disaccharide deacetylase